MIAALQTLEGKISALKAGDETQAANQALTQQVQALEARVAELRAAGEETVKDLDLARGQLADLAGGAHG